MILGLLYFLCILAAVLYGLFVLMRAICSNSEGYTSLHMGAGCLVVPFLTIITVTSLSTLWWSIEPTLHQRRFLLHEFVFSIIALPVIGWLRYDRSRRLQASRSQP